VDLIGIPYQEEQLDDAGHPRNVWMFPLRLKPGGITPVLTEAEARAIEENQSKKARQLSTAELKERAQRSKKTPSVRVAQTSAYVRDAAVAEYVKRLANGVCDLCEQPAPFQTKQNEAYLECHHITWLAHGGEDTISNIRREIERMRSQVHRQRGEIRQLQRAGISTASAEELLDRMLNKIDDLCAERDRVKREQGSMKGVLGGRSW
jgi:hypothetical protein